MSCPCVPDLYSPRMMHKLDVLYTLPDDATILFQGSVVAGEPAPNMRLSLEMPNALGAWTEITNIDFGTVQVGQSRALTTSPTPAQLLALLGFYGSHLVRGKLSLSNIYGSIQELSLEIPFTLAEVQASYQPTITSFDIFPDKTVVVWVQESGAFDYLLRVKKTFDGPYLEAGQCLGGICYIAGSVEHPEFAGSSGVLIGSSWTGGPRLDGHTMRRAGGGLEPISFDSGTYYVELRQYGCYQNQCFSGDVMVRKKLVVP